MKDFVSGGVFRVSALVGSFALVGVACLILLQHGGGPGLALGGVAVALLGVFWGGNTSRSSLAQLLDSVHGTPVPVTAGRRRAAAPSWRKRMSGGGGLR